jgi:hypothetical protein
VEEKSIKVLCPRCGNRNEEHTIVIERDCIMGLSISSSPQKSPSVKRQIDVFLTCPKKGTDFIVTLGFCETSTNKIKQVTEKKLK